MVTIPGLTTIICVHEVAVGELQSMCKVGKVVVQEMDCDSGHVRGIIKVIPWLQHVRGRHIITTELHYYYSQIYANT